MSGRVSHQTANPHRLVEAGSPYVLTAGSVISASLITGLRSDLPGLVTAQVTEGVYDSPTGRVYGELAQSDLAKIGITLRLFDVALIDTGVTQVPGLDAPGKVVDGPDLSFESQDPTRAYKDNYGHGTHLAGRLVSRGSRRADAAEATRRRIVEATLALQRAWPGRS